MPTRASLVPARVIPSVTTADKPAVKVACNNDQVIIAWRYEEAIEDCIGFAIYRKLENDTGQVNDVLVNRVGFEDEPYEKGEQRPSTEWPIQRQIWTDFTVRHGDTVSYQVVPVLFNGEILIVDYKNASAWTHPITVSTGIDSDGDGTAFHAYFNRGVVSSQFFVRMQKEFIEETKQKTLKAVIEGPNSKLRNFLGGFLDNRLFALLDEIEQNPNLSVYGALYELHQEDLIEKLCTLGNRAHIILANGAAKSKGEDKNAHSRKELYDHGVVVYDRIVDVTRRHFAHNKFLVICEDGRPKKVWTGSTNWTPGGMYAQVNNALLIENEQAASIFLDEWKSLKKDVEENSNEYGEALYQHNRKAFRFSKGKTRVWFSPIGDFNDLRDVENLLENAKTGVLFLMFNPGPADTFFNYIQDLQERKPGLFIHGIINQDPGGKNPLIFFHKGQKVETDWNAIFPKAFSEDYAFWYKEVSPGMVTIHSKVLVIDPFGAQPFVITGSHNFGPKASSTNDENMVVINDRRLAEEYAVNIMAIYDHYRWRYSLFHQNTDYKGLTKERDWMATYMTDELRKKELDFWLLSQR